MLFQPAIIALLLASLLSVAMLAAAAPFAAQLIRHWNIASGSELQLRLERRTYLFSTLTAVVFAAQILALLLTVFNADHMAVMFVGAMCAVGTLNANAWGFPMLYGQIAVFFLAAAWLTLNHVDNQAPDYPLVRVKYALLIALLPVVAAVGWLQLRYFLNLRADVITSCCGSLFSNDSQTLASEASGMEAKPAFLFYSGLTAAIGGALALATGQPAQRVFARRGQRRRLCRGDHRRALLHLALHLRTPAPPLPLLHFEAGIRLSGLLALPAAVHRHRGRTRGRRLAALRPGAQPGERHPRCLGPSGRHRRRWL
jgi:hypothetical protein